MEVLKQILILLNHQIGGHLVIQNGEKKKIFLGQFQEKFMQMRCIILLLNQGLQSIQWLGVEC